MQEQDQNPSGQEVKREIPNQHLADRIAGKVDEQGKELSETKSEVSNVESGVPNQHLADKIAGKVDHNNVAIEEGLGGVESENEVSTETTTTEAVSETETTTTEAVSEAESTTTATTEEVVSDAKAEEVVSPQQDGTQGIQG